MLLLAKPNAQSAHQGSIVQTLIKITSWIALLGKYHSEAQFHANCALKIMSVGTQLCPLAQFITTLFKEQESAFHALMGNNVIIPNR